MGIEPETKSIDRKTSISTAAGASVVESESGDGFSRTTAASLKQGYDVDYSVSIRQEPIRGRMCGLGDTVARRMLDPPFIVQMDFTNKDMFSEVEIHSVVLRFLCFVTIHTVLADGSIKDAGVLVTNPSRSLMYNRSHSQYLQTLLGQRAVSPLYLDDISLGKKKFFFVFSDLAIRIQGDYVLKCQVIDLYKLKSKFLQSQPFQIYPPQSYPGILEPTTLSKSFYVQGVPLRSGAYSKKHTYDSLLPRSKESQSTVVVNDVNDIKEEEIYNP